MTDDLTAQINDLARAVWVTGRSDTATAAAEILSERSRQFAALNAALDANENGEGGIGWKAVTRLVEQFGKER